MRVLSGEHKGRIGTVDMATTVRDQEQPGNIIPAYYVKLDGDTWYVVLRWDEMAHCYGAGTDAQPKPCRP